MIHSVVVLDLDGVILKTNFIKYRAMLSLFADYGDLQGRISDYILAQGGVPRREKFIEILRNIIGTTPTEPLLTNYLQRYAHALEYELAIAPLVDGVADFLVARSHTFYVSSSAPDAEVARQLARRNLSHYFATVYGLQTPKAEALRQIVAAHPTATVVFFGDSVGDWEAAQEAGVGFVGVVNERDNFVGQSVVKLNNFMRTPVIEECMQRAWQNFVSRRES